VRGAGEGLLGSRGRRPLLSVEGLCGARIVYDVQARGVTISNACWRERVGEAWPCWTTPSVAVSIASSTAGGKILASGGERLRVGGTGRSGQS